MPDGANYTIYKYISEYKWQHGVYPSITDGVNHMVHPSYRDYTPFNSIVYEIIFLSNNYDQLIYLIYQTVVLTIGFYVLCFLAVSRYLSIYTLVAISLYFLLNPLVIITLLGDDKAIFFTLPLLCIWIARRWPKFLPFAVGVFAGWSGLGVVALPLLWFQVKRIPKKIMFSLIGFVIAIGLLLILGEESLSFFQNRLMRNAKDPFWFSIWRVLPEFFWPDVRAPLFLFMASIIMYKHWEKVIRFDIALLGLSALYFLFANNTVHTRLLMFLPLLTFCFERERSRWAFLLIGFSTGGIIHMFIIAKLHETYSELMVIVCNLPLLLALSRVYLTGFLFSDHVSSSKTIQVKSS